jgi:YHS domain-containing protein
MVTAALMVSLPSAVWAKDRINTNWWGVAVKGYDTVAYFTMGEPVKGKKDFEYRWQGAKWRFANQKHLDLFKSDPERYAPRYGGY